MLKLNFILAFRNLLKSKLYSSINVFGLATGFMAFLCIVLYVQDELGFDDFHGKKDRIYRLVNTTNGRNLAIAPPIWSSYLKEEISTVENAVTLQPLDVVVTKDNKPFAQSNAFATHPSFFEIFDFPVVAGSRENLLISPTDLVISTAAALKYFGTSDAVGEVLELTVFGNKEPLVVKAVLDCPSNSHLRFDLLLPHEFVKKHFHTPRFYDNWKVSFVYTYLLMKGDIDEEKLSVEFKDFLFRHGGDELTGRFSPGVETLKSIYLESELVYDAPPRGDLSQVKALMITAVALLVIALANFINLSTAQSLKRAKEVGLRKVFGSGRKALIFQFLTESTLISFLAMFLAIGLWVLVRPYYNDFTEKEFAFTALLAPQVLWIILLSPLVAGILAGLYPAMIISGFKPLKALRSRSTSGAQGQWARKGLVVFQFGTAIILLVSTLVVYRQVNFMSQAEMGFNEEQVIAIKDNGAISANAQKRELLKTELQKINEVGGISVSSNYPGDITGSSRYVPDGYAPDESVSVSSIFADFDFVETYEIEILDGRNMNKQLSTDSSAFLINEAAQRLFAGKDASWSENPIGKQIDFPSQQKKGPVVGVFKNFNFQSLHAEMRPLIITTHSARIFVVQIRMNTSNIDQTLSAIADRWSQLFPDTPFDYVFVDEAFERHYRAEKRLGTLFMLFSVLSIFIALLGLFSLASFMTQERAKELSIRKVVGASNAQLFLMLIKKLNLLVIIGNVIGLPIAFLLMNNWLEAFAYRTPMPWYMFAGAFLLSLLVSTLSTTYHAVKSANQNPAVVLAQE